MTVPSMSYTEYLTEVAVTRPKNIREGQHAYNVLDRVHPDLGRLVMGTNVDPFYNDLALPAFHVYVQASWDSAV